MPGFGSNAVLAVTRQNSFGGSVVTSWHKCSFANHGLDFRYAELEDDSILGRYDAPDRVTGIAAVTGAIEGNFNPIAYGHFLRGVFGVYSVTALGSGYQHIFRPQTAAFGNEHSLPPYSFYIDQGEAGVNSGYLATDCFINGMELAVNAPEYARARFDILGKTASVVAKVTPFDHGTFKPFVWASGSLQIFGAANARYENIRVAFNNNVTGQNRIAGAKEHTYFFRDGFRGFGIFTGTADIAQADWTRVKSETEGAFTLNLAGISISSGVVETLRVELPRVVITTHPLGVSGPGIVTVEIAGRAMYSTGSGLVAQVTLINTLASYAT